MTALQNQDTSMMEYKGFICHFAFDEKDKLFHGRVANSHYFIEFKGHSIRELTETFHKAIEDHIEWCKKHKKNQGNNYKFIRPSAKVGR